jgi:hypothetical protein
MTKTVFDFSTPTWMKWGVVVYANDTADRDRQIAEIAGGSATVTITSERAASDAEVARYRAYRQWGEEWRAKAATGEAGRHMAHPVSLVSGVSQVSAISPPLPKDSDVPRKKDSVRGTKEASVKAVAKDSDGS